MDWLIFRNKKGLKLISIMLAVLALLVVAPIAARSAPGLSDRSADPKRWYQEDTTPQQHWQTSLKEANAALHEALQDCKLKKGAERSSCQREARQRYQDDLAQAKESLKMAQQSASK